MTHNLKTSLPFVRRSGGLAARLLALAIASAFAGPRAMAAGPTTISHGQYVDNTGVTNNWTVNAAHTLIWDDKPFVPVGGEFQAKSWSATATDADWDSDVAALVALKARNVTDIYLQSAQGGLLTVPPKAIQRLVDYLDKQGFTYGISINDEPRDVLSGYLVRPGAYRKVVGGNTSDIRFTIDGISSALYFVVSPDELQVAQAGDATLTQDGVVISSPDLPESAIAFLIPQKTYVPGRNSPTGLVNLWDGFDGYRDSLLALFRGVRLGKGFRFFVDALPPNMSVSGSEFEHLVPTGAGFTTEWSAWLGKKYRSLDAIEDAWGIQDREIKDIDEMAQLVPLWNGTKGIEAVYDRTNGHRLKVDTYHSKLWRDLNQFKFESVRGYMSDLASVLKKAVADVPVVYRSDGQSSLFVNLPSDVGFDGLGINAYGRGNELISSNAGNVSAEAADSFKTMWLPVTATADAGPAEKSGKGYATQLAMNADLDRLREIGARGFYVDGVRITDPARKNFDLSESPEQLSWLAAYERVLIATGIGAAATVPNAIYYPRELLTASPRELGEGKWWLPTNRPGVTFDFGTAGRAYALSESGDTVYYLYNPTGPGKIHIRIPKASLKTVSWSPLAAGELHKDLLTLTLGPDSIIRVFKLASLPVPEETVPAMLAEGEALVNLMRSQGNLEAGRFQQQLGTVSLGSPGDQPYNMVLRIQDILTVMRQILRPYAWIEAETLDARVQTFDEISDRAGASGGRVLVVEPRTRDAAPAVAVYPITVKEDGVFDVWVAASPNAPLSFRLDSQPLLDSMTLPKAVGAPYANGTLVWTHYGSATLQKGAHKLELRANGPAAVDVILLMHGGAFVPDGPNPPPVLTLVPETHDKAHKR